MCKELFLYTKEDLIGFKTIVRKEVNRVFRIWSQTLVSSPLTTTLYFVIFGNLIGNRIGDMGGYRYIEYIVPGLIMMAVLVNSYSNVVSSFYSARFQKSLDEIVVSPLPPSLIILGYVTAGVVRGLVVGTLVLLISLFFAELNVYNIWLVFIVVLVTSSLFATVGLINGLFAKNFDDISYVPTFILTPLTYLGGVFYSINMLPEFWQKVSMFNPIMYIVNAFRFAMLGVSDINVTYALIVICGFLLVFYSIAYYLLKEGVRIKA